MDAACEQRVLVVEVRVEGRPADVGAVEDLTIRRGVPSLHEELLALVSLGMTAMAALQSATKNPAEFLGRDRVEGSVRPQRLDRLFEGVERVVRTCPECSKKKLPLGALIVHVNDAHHWTRERIAAWVADPDVPQDEPHAHH